MTLTAYELDTAQAGLDMDQRIFHQAEIAEHLDQLATEIAKLRRLADAVPADYSSPFTALALVEAAGRMRVPGSHVATVVHLLDLLQHAAVRQARAHGCTWEAIAAKTAEAQPNLVRRFTSK